MPDKAVDLIDEAAAKIQMEMNSAPAVIDDARRKLIQLEVEREALKEEKDANSKDLLSNVKTEIITLKSLGCCGNSSDTSGRGLHPFTV